MRNVRDSQRPSWLQFLPGPPAIANALGLLPTRWQSQCLAAIVNRHVFPLLPKDSLSFLQERRLAIEVGDLRLRWVFSYRHGRLEALSSDMASETTIRGNALDLMLLASRLEDPDTLFFQRRLVMIGDTALGLEARNLLDQLVWEHLPFALRLVLNRSVQLGLKARRAASQSQPSLKDPSPQA